MGCVGGDDAVAVGGADDVGGVDSATVGGDAGGVCGGPRDGEGALAQGEGAFDEVDGADCFGDDEREIGVGLGVDIRPLVDGYASPCDLEVGAVLSIEAAEEELAGFALASMLNDGDAGYEAESVVGGAQGCGGEVVGGEGE